MRMQIGQVEIKLEHDKKTENKMSFSIVFPFDNNWIEIAVTKGLISETNLHIEVNVDKEIL